jgi:4-hydroxyacetophenone monooxygenase
MTIDVSASPSPFVNGVEQITASDDEIAAALLAAELPPLLPSLAYLTGDLGLLRRELRPDPLLAGMPQGGFTDTQQDEIRRLALDVLVAYRDGGSRPAAPPSDDDLLAILEHTVGVDGMAPYLPLLEEELAFRGEDRRSPGWHAADLAPDRRLRVVVVGAGMSGILAAHRLGQAGVDYTVLDKNDDVGGTWHESVYPGCRVDNPNHNYSYSFAQRHDWPYFYSPQPELARYFRECAEVFGVREHIRFGCTVTSLEWQDDTSRWKVTFTDERGAVSVLEAEVVVSAVGQLNRPLWPEIDGMTSFAGTSFHSAQWRHDVDLTGRRVGVIGTGASAMQFIPEIAERADELVVFQRTPAWLAPTADYHDRVPAGLTWLYRHVPTYSELHRFAIFWRMGDGALEGVRVDPNWQSDGSSVSAVSEFARQVLVEYYRAEFGDRPDLLDRVVPGYPVAAKRMVRDNGIWARTLKRPNVRLVTEPIARIDEQGVVVDDGGRHDVDVIIYGTGYQASDFLGEIQVTGRGGVDLHDLWGGDARAYLGVSIPSMPNLFCLYGPNTNIVINGSIIYFSECGVRYIVGLVRALLEEGLAAIEVRADVHDRFNVAVDAENRAMAWGWSDVNSWYKNAHGRVSQNWPFTLLEYWQRTLRPDLAEFAVVPLDASAR